MQSSLFCCFVLFACGPLLIDVYAHVDDLPGAGRAVERCADIQHFAVLTVEHHAAIDAAYLPAVDVCCRDAVTLNAEAEVRRVGLESTSPGFNLDPVTVFVLSLHHASQREVVIQHNRTQRRLLGPVSQLCFTKQKESHFIR